MANRPSVLEYTGMLCGLRIPPRTMERTSPGWDRGGADRRSFDASFACAADAIGKIGGGAPAGPASRRSAAGPWLLRRSTWRHETLAPTDRSRARRAPLSPRAPFARRKRPSRGASPRGGRPSSSPGAGSRRALRRIGRPTRPAARDAAPTPRTRGKRRQASTPATTPSTPATRAGAWGAARKSPSACSPPFS